MLWIKAMTGNCECEASWSPSSPDPAFVCTLNMLTTSDLFVPTWFKGLKLCNVHFTSVACHLFLPCQFLIWTNEKTSNFFLFCLSHCVWEKNIERKNVLLKNPKKKHSDRHAFKFVYIILSVNPLKNLILIVFIGAEPDESLSPEWLWVSSFIVFLIFLLLLLSCTSFNLTVTP